MRFDPAPLLAARYALKGVWIAAIAALILLLAGFALVQTARIEGLKLWPVSIEGWKPRAERLEADLRNVRIAQAASRALQEQTNRTAEAGYRRIAERIDTDADTELARQLDAADRYIAAHRVSHSVRTEAAGGSSGRAGAASSDRGARGGQAPGEAAELDDPGGGAGSAGADDPVSVSAEDVRICTINTLQAEAARSWALEIEEASRSD